MSSSPFKSTLSAILLITGCCIGAGMIGLPIKSALAGFMPSTLAMVVCYVFTTITGLFIVEATLWFNERVNLPTIVNATLGKKSKFLTLFLFLALFYSLFVAYLDGLGMIISEILSSMTGYTFTKAMGIVICTILIAVITYAGTHLANRLNQLLLLGMIISYLLLITIGFTTHHIANTQSFHMMSTLNVIPIMLICFGYQNLVPTVTYYLKKNVQLIRYAIIIGNFIPLLIYVLWNYVILNILPIDHSVLKNAEMITQLLQNTATIVSIAIIVKSFSLFAMLTSCIPNALSLVDFIKDGIKISFHSKIKTDLFYLALIFIPSFLFTMSYPYLFLNMLDFAGGFVDVLLFGILPALVILVGRRRVAVGQHYQVFGGIMTPVIIIMASVTILMMKVGII
jgi:tyrosine-specific transport protein